MGFVEQLKERGIGGPGHEIQAQSLIQRIPVPLLLRRSLRLGERFEITGAPAAAQDPQHRPNSRNRCG
jgi:hypothetical protein